MKIIGIIAEYNPFHNGHAYQIEEIRKRTGADYIIAAMSGDFVQRGAPAIVDKYARAKMALSCGVDLVIELPALWATASAENFAMAGITLFDKMGCVDGLCFGAETDNLPLLMQLADILVEEPDAYKTALSSYIKEGLNFPTARARAICDIFSQDIVSPGKYPSAAASSNAGAIAPAILTEVLSSPNNILAIEYLKALKRRTSSITPLLLKREGAGYHETDILEDTGTATIQSPTASATAIRQILTQASIVPTTGLPRTSAAHAKAEDAIPPRVLSSLENTMPSCALSSLENTMPSCALSVLTDYLAEAPAIGADDFSQILGYLLLSSAPEHLAEVGDCNTDIANRLLNNRQSFCTFLQFCEQSKSRDITYTRISRVLMHIVLHFTNDDYEYFAGLNFIPYLRVLGFRKESVGLFKEIKSNTAIPLITKLADAETILSGDALTLLKKDIFAAELYEQIKVQKTAPAIFSGQNRQKKTTPRSEYTREIVRL